ncbi:MAG: AsmA family protein, partial [Desulfosarcina sp.]|nr:AsmA family protein [Desulfobacterales bacterium]
VGFKLRFEAPTLEIAEPIMGVSIMRSLGPIRGQVDVNGTTEALSFDNILVTGGRSGRLYVDWRGRIKKIPLIEGEVLSGQETSGTLSAARSSDFAALFGVTLADVGPVRGSWRDTDHEGIVGMSDIKVVIGDGKTFDLQVNGAIAEIVDLNKDREEIEIQWINFQFELNTSDSHGIAKLIGVAMPDLGALNGRWTISGGEKSLAVRNVSLTSLSSGGLKTQTTGSVGHIAPEAGGALKDVDLQFTGKAPDFRAVPGLGGLNLPALGPLRVEAHLKDQDGALNLDRLTIHTGDEDKPTLRLQGRIDRIQDWERMDFQADFETLAQPWLQMLLKDPVTESPVLQGALRIGRIDDGWRIDKFKLGTREQGGLSMEGAGTIRMEGDSPSVDMQIFSKMADPSAWGRLFDVSLPSLAPTQITGWYRENENRHQFSGEIRLGDSRFQTDFNASTHDRKPVIEATLAAQTLRLQDLGFYPQSQPSAPPSTPAPHAETPPRLFDEEPLPLAILQDFDLSLKILADQIISREIAFKQIGLDLTVKDGRLQIGPITAKYLNGDATIDATIDTNETPPVMALNMAVEDADIEEVLTSVDRPLILGGQLTLFADLHSSGRSAHEIAAHLQGETGFVIEHGRIKREIELMASDALDFLFTGPASQTYTALNCTAFRMRFKEGTGTIQVFFVETPGMRAEAYGHVDLADETIALVVNPTSKRRLIRRSSPVRIKGSLQDPSIVKVPVEEAAILAGQIFVPYVALPARALGYLWSLIKRDKDEENTCFLPPETDP